MQVGRNDPCPCGSGQKFKKCHGAMIPVRSAERTCGRPAEPCRNFVCGWLRPAAQQRGERFGFGPPAFQQEMLGRLQRGERLW